MARRFGAVLTALALLLGGCGGSASPTPSATDASQEPSPSPGPSPSPTPAPTPDPSPEPSPEPEPVSPLAGVVIVIDPGHNGQYKRSFNTAQVPDGAGGTKDCNTSGTASNAGWPEHAYTWDQAQVLSAELQARGATVIMTRSDDAGLGPCVNDRAQIVNDAGADLLISLHADGNTSSSARGFHVIYSTSMAGGSSLEESSQRYAELARDALAANTPMPKSTYVGGGEAITPRRDIATVNLLETTPGIMVEMGNMRSATDAALLADPNFQRQVATALADASATYLAPR